MSRFGGTSALLQKVSSTLKGEKTQEDDDGLGAYLSGLSKKPKTLMTKKKEIDWNKFDEVSDLSDDEPPKKKAIETNIGSAGSKFLKKKPIQNEKPTAVKTSQSKQQKSAVLSKAMGFSTQFENKPKQNFLRMSDSDMDLSFSMDGQILGDVESLTPAKAPRSKSLDKSGSEDSMSIGRGGSKFLKKQSATEKPPPDHHSPIRKEQTFQKNVSKGQVGQFEKQKQSVKQPLQSGQAQQFSRQTPQNRSAGFPSGSSQPQQHGMTQAHQNHFHKQNFGKAREPALGASFEIDTDSSSMSIGKGGSKFMKKKPAELKVIVSPKETGKKTEPLPTGQSTNKKRDMFSLKSAEKYSTTVQLDSEEESFQGYIQDLGSSKSDVSIKTPPKSPKAPKSILKTPRTPRSLTPLADIDEHEEKTSNQTMSEEDSFKSETLESTVIDTCHDHDSTFIDMSVNVLDLDDLDPPNFSPPEATYTSTPKPGVKTGKSYDNKKGSKNKKEKERYDRKAKHKKQKSSSVETEDDDLFAKMGLQTVDDLLGDNKTDFTDTDIGTDIEREDDDYFIRRSPSPLRSILSPSPRPDKTPRSGRTPRVRYSLEEVTEIRSRSPSPEVISSAQFSKSASVIHTTGYDDDFESVIKTEEPSETEESLISEHIGSIRNFRHNRSRSESEYYSDDFVSATESRWTSKRRENALSNKSESFDSEYSMYSDTFSEFSESRADSRSKTHRSRSPKSRKKSGKVKEAQIQTGASISDLAYKWVPEQTGVAYVTPGYGLTNLDPKLVASHVVSADALEALSTYSPSVLALNEMLRQQLQLTDNYITMQKNLHHSLVHSSEADFIYTTLEDTKRYIKKHKKTTLTFDQALRQVKQEMGID